MTFRVQRAQALSAPPERAVQAFLYDMATADPCATEIIPGSLPGRHQYAITVPDLPDAVIADVTITRVRGRGYVVGISSDNAQGRFQATVAFHAAGHGTRVTYDAVVEPAPGPVRGINVTATSYGHLVDQVLERVEAVSVLLDAPGRQLDAAVVAKVKALSIAGPREMGLA